MPGKGKTAPRSRGKEKQWDTYQDYLNSDAWAAIRYDVKQRADEHCEVCGCVPEERDMAGHCHHWVYPKDWANDSDDNVVYACASCHTLIHEHYEINSTPEQTCRWHAIAEYRHCVEKMRTVAWNAKKESLPLDLIELVANTVNTHGLGVFPLIRQDGLVEDRNCQVLNKLAGAINLHWLKRFDDAK